MPRAVEAAVPAAEKTSSPKVQATRLPPQLLLQRIRSAAAAMISRNARGYSVFQFFGIRMIGSKLFRLVRIFSLAGRTRTGL